MSEMDKLERYLRENNITYTRVINYGKDANEINSDSLPVTNQIIVIGKHGRNWDAICHPGSYGYKQGLLEVMGSIVDVDKVGDTCEGYLTADDIIHRLDDQLCRC